MQETYGGLQEHETDNYTKFRDIEDLSKFKSTLETSIARARIAPLLIFSALPIVIIAYVINDQLISLLLSTIAITILFIGGYLQYLFLLSLARFRRIVHGQELSFTDFIVTSLKISLYIILLGILFSYQDNIKALEIISRETNSVTLPCKENLSLTLLSLGILLSRLQSCTLTTLLRFLNSVIENATSIDLGTERDNWE